MQDGGFPNCRMNFAPWGLRDGREGKEDVVWCSIELKISTPKLKSLSLRIDFRGGGMCVKTQCMSEQVVCEKREETGSLLCRAAPHTRPIISQHTV